MLFEDAFREKGVCSRRLGYVWRGLVFNALYFFARIQGTVCSLHLQHKFCLKGKKSIFYAAFYSSLTNFQLVRNLLGVQLPSFQYAYFFYLTCHIEDPL